MRFGINQKRLAKRETFRQISAISYLFRTRRNKFNPIRIKYTKEEDKLLNNYAEWLFKIFRKKCHRQMGTIAKGFNTIYQYFI